MDTFQKETRYYYRYTQFKKYNNISGPYQNFRFRAASQIPGFSAGASPE